MKKLIFICLSLFICFNSFLINSYAVEGGDGDISPYIGDDYAQLWLDINNPLKYDDSGFLFGGFNYVSNNSWYYDIYYVHVVDNDAVIADRPSGESQAYSPQIPYYSFVNYDTVGKRWSINFNSSNSLSAYFYRLKRHDDGSLYWSYSRTFTPTSSNSTTFLYTDDSFVPSYYYVNGYGCLLSGALTSLGYRPLDLVFLDDGDKRTSYTVEQIRVLLKDTLVPAVGVTESQKEVIKDNAAKTDNLSSEIDSYDKLESTQVDGFNNSISKIDTSSFDDLLSSNSFLSAFGVVGEFLSLIYDTNFSLGRYVSFSLILGLAFALIGFKVRR